MLPKSRLGKRSPLGALVSSACPAAGPHVNLETGETDVSAAPSRVKGPSHPGLKVRGVERSVRPVMFQFIRNSDGKNPQTVCFDQASLSQVYFHCGAGESYGAVDQPDVKQTDVSVPPPGSSRSVSSCIDVPRRSDVFSVSVLITHLLVFPFNNFKLPPPPPAVSGGVQRRWIWTS